LFHKSNVFGSCIIHILYTGCAKILKNNSGARKLKRLYRRLQGSRDGKEGMEKLNNPISTGIELKSSGLVK